MRFRVYKNKKGYWVIEKSSAFDPTSFHYINYHDKFEDARAEVAHLATMARYFYGILSLPKKKKPNGNRH